MGLGLSSFHVLMFKIFTAITDVMFPSLFFNQGKHWGTKRLNDLPKATPSAVAVRIPTSALGYRVHALTTAQYSP